MLDIVSAEGYQKDWNDVESLRCIGGVVWNAYQAPAHTEPRSSQDVSLYSSLTIVNREQTKEKKKILTKKTLVAKLE